MFKNQKAFTLVELLIVLAIIAILTTTITLLVLRSTTKARDSQRVQEINAIAQALRYYYLDHKEFPGESDGYNGYIGTGGTLDAALAPYMGSVPQDPNHDAANYYYYYDAYHACYDSATSYYDYFATVTVYSFEDSDYDSQFSNRTDNCAYRWGGEGGSKPDYVIKLYPYSR